MMSHYQIANDQVAAYLSRTGHGGVTWPSADCNLLGQPGAMSSRALMVTDKVGRPAGEFGMSKSMECDSFPFSVLTLSVG